MKNMVMFILPSNQARNQFFASSNFKTLHSVLQSQLQMVGIITALKAQQVIQNPF